MLSCTKDDFSHICERIDHNTFDALVLRLFEERGFTIVEKGQQRFIYERGEKNRTAVILHSETDFKKFGEDVDTNIKGSEEATPDSPAVVVDPAQLHQWLHYAIDRNKAERITSEVLDDAHISSVVEDNRSETRDLHPDVFYNEMPRQILTDKLIELLLGRVV